MCIFHVWKDYIIDKKQIGYRYCGQLLISYNTTAMSGHNKAASNKDAHSSAVDAGMHHKSTNKTTKHKEQFPSQTDMHVQKTAGRPQTRTLGRYILN